MQTIRLSQLLILLAAFLIAALGGLKFVAASATSTAPGTRPDTASTHAKNLKAIGQALAIYGAEWNDRLPTSMEVLLADYSQTNINSQPFVETLAGPDVQIPAEVLKGDRAQQAAWLSIHGSYLILDFGKRFAVLPNPAKTPLAIQRPDRDPASPKLGVLYHDGHVESRDRAEVEAMVPKTGTPATSSLGNGA